MEVRKLLTLPALKDSEGCPRIVAVLFVPDDDPLGIVLDDAAENFLERVLVDDNDGRYGPCQREGAESK